MYHYTESGLRNVWLTNGYKTRKTADGVAVSIADVDGLHQVIGKAIACKPHLTGTQFRFLRKELDLSQARVGSLLGASEESVSLWERRGRVPKSAAILLQSLYLETINGSVQIKKLVELMADLDRQEQEKMYFADSDSGWLETEPDERKVM